MADSTPSDGPLVAYDPGERLTHDEHAGRAYEFAQTADVLRGMNEHRRLDRVDVDATAQACDVRAQWHATMAVYEALDEARGMVISSLIDLGTEIRTAGES